MTNEQADARWKELQIEMSALRATYDSFVAAVQGGTLSRESAEIEMKAAFRRLAELAGERHDMERIMQDARELKQTGDLVAKLSARLIDIVKAAGR